MSKTIPTLKNIPPYPQRKDPQDRFDELIKAAVDGGSLMVADLNTTFIPAANAFGAEVEASKDAVAGSATAAASSAMTANAAKIAAESAKTAAETAQSAAVTAKTQAETARTGAESAKITAETAKTQAAASAAGASGSAATATSKAEAASDSASIAAKKAEEADDSATAAASSATAANTAKTAAESAKTAAETAQSAAVTAKTQAEAAQAGAESAQDAAETARTAAETAQSAAETARTQAATSAAGASESAATTTSKAKDASDSASIAAKKAEEAGDSATAAASSTVASNAAKTAAESAKTAAETAQSAAVIAKTQAEAAQAGAESAQDAAEAAKTAIESSKDAAAASATDAAESADEAARAVQGVNLPVPGTQDTGKTLVWTGTAYGLLSYVDGVPTPTPNAIPKSGPDGTLDAGWLGLPDPSDDNIGEALVWKGEGYETQKFATSWPDIPGKPETFPPSEHGHTVNDVSGLQALLNLKADTTTVNTALAEKADATRNQTAHDALTAAIAAAEGKATWEGLTGKPETFPPSEHGHEWAEIRGTPTVADIPTPNAIPKSGPDGTLDVGWLPGLAKPIAVMTITPTVSANVAADYKNRIILHGVSALLGGTVTKYRITYGEDAPVTVNATSGDYTGAFIPTGTLGEIYTIIIVGIDNLSNESEPIVVQRTIAGSSITQPSIITPIAESQLVRTGITITTDPFALTGLVDAHLKSRYRIRRADDDTVLYDSGEVADLTSHSVPEGQFSDLTEGTCDILIDAQHLGPPGWSGWGTACAVEIIGKGTRIGGKATVIGMMKGYPSGTKDQWVAVLDAAYRGVDIKWGKYDTDLTGLVNFGTGTFTYKGGTIGSNEAVSSIVTKTRDPQTSKKNTDYLVTQNSGTDSQGVVGVPAAVHCRDISINGTTAQFPNHQTLAFIFSRRAFVDESDPTADANITRKLVNWGFGSATGAYVWGSSENNSGGASHVNSGGSLGVGGKYGQFGVIPVLEIPA